MIHEHEYNAITTREYIKFDIDVFETTLKVSTRMGMGAGFVYTNQLPDDIPDAWIVAVVHGINKAHNYCGQPKFRYEIKEIEGDFTTDVKIIKEQAFLFTKKLITEKLDKMGR